MQIHLSLRRTRALLLGVWGMLVLAGLAVELVKWASGRTVKNALSYFFGLSYEQNLPTWYSASLLLLCAIMLTLISISRFQERAKGLRSHSTGDDRWHWTLLSAIFYYISLDEAVTLHESLSNFFDYGGVLFFGWVIPASIVVLVLGAVFLPFVRRLPAPTRRQVMTAGVLYVGGALGVEFLLGYWTDLAGDKNLVYGLIDLVEESLEMLGVTWFLLSLLQYAAASPHGLHLETHD